MLIRKDDSLLLVIDVQERTVPQTETPREVINNCAHLVSISKAIGIPSIITEHNPKGQGKTIIDIRLAAGEEKTYQEKEELSCWLNEKIKQSIEESSKKQIIICGVETHINVLQTAMDLQQAGYEVFVVANACSSRENLQHIYALQRLSHNDVEIVSYEMVVYEWLRTTSAEQYKEIIKKYAL